MNRWLGPTMTVVVVTGAQALACGTSESSMSSSYPTFDDAGEEAGEPLADAGTPRDEAAPEAAATQAYARLAAWSPDEVAVDFCVAPHGTTTYDGPLVARLAAADDAGAGDAEAGPPGLSFPQVTAYVALAPGSYDVTLVAGGSASCAAGILDATSLPALAAGSYTTFALVGDAQADESDRALSLATFRDDTGTSAPSGASLRFINAAPSLPAVDLGSGSLQDADFQALFTDVHFAGTASQSGSDAGTVDTNGYLAYSPLTGAVLSAHVSTGATSDTAVADGVALGLSTATTIVLVGARSGDAGMSAQLLQCTDGADVGWLSACAPISP